MFTTKSAALSRDINRIVTDMGTTLGSAFNPRFVEVLRRIFSKGEQGFFYDPFDLKTQYQATNNAIPVTGTGQPIGFILDKKNAAYVSYVVNQKSFTDLQGWVVGSDMTVSVVEGEVLLTLGGTIGASSARWFRPDLPPVEGNTVWEISFDATYISGGNLEVGAGYNIGRIIDSSENGGVKKSYSVIAIQHTVGPRHTCVFGGVAGSVWKLSNIRCRQVLGNHAYQTTSAARPVLRSIPILGAEVIVDPEFNDPSYWNVSAAGTTSVSGGFARFHAAPTGNNVNRGNVITLGKTYLFEININSITQGALRLSIGLGTGGASSQDFRRAGVYRFIGTASKTSIPTIQITSIGDAVATVDSISVKEVLGYKTNTFIEYDGIDDKLVTNLPSALTNCTVLRAIPDVGTQVKYNQTLPMLYEDSTNHAGLFAINRALTRKEQLRIMKELDRRAGATSLETLTFKTFDNNQEGFVYDPNDLSTMFQDAAGNVPVTGNGQPVGLIFDKSKGLRTVPLSTSWDGTFLNGFANMNSSNYWTIVNGRAYHAFSAEAVALTLSVPSQKAGVFMEFDAEVLTAKDTAQVQINGTTTITFNFGSGRHKVFLPAGSTSLQFKRNPALAGAEFYIDNVTLHEVQGNHAYQTASASRPVLLQNASTGAYYLEFDGVDDRLVTGSLPSMGLATTIFTGSRANKAATSAVVARGVGGYLYQTAGSVAVQSVSKPVTILTSGNAVITVKYEGSGTGVTLKANNVSRTESTTDRGFNTSNPLVIGAFSNGGEVPLQGHIYCLIGISKLTTDAESIAIEKEIAKRLGVTLNV